MSDKNKKWGLADTYAGLETATKLTHGFDFSFENFTPPWPTLSPFTSADFSRLMTEGSFEVSGPMPPLLDAISGALDTRYFTIGDVQMIVRVKDYIENDTESKLEMEILDVLSPPAAREKWLHEKGQQ